MLHIGAEKEIYTKLQDAREIEATKKEELDQAMEKASELLRKKKAANGKIPEIMESRIKDLDTQIKTLKQEVEENREERKKCEVMIIQGKDAEVIVNGNVYRGAVVCLAQQQMPVERSTCFMKFFNDRGVIGSSVIAYS